MFANLRFDAAFWAAFVLRTNLSPEKRCRGEIDFFLLYKRERERERFRIHIRFWVGNDVSFAHVVYINKIRGFLSIGSGE